MAWNRSGRWMVVGTCMALAVWGVRAECSRVVISSDPAYPPLHWYDGETLQGASIEIAKRVLSDLKIPYEVRYLGPFPRVMALAERGEVDMVVTLKKTPEREAFLLYPKTPALSNPVAVFGFRERPFVFRERSDLVGLRGGITRGNVFGNGLDEYIREWLKVEESSSPESNFDKLALGRLDYFITGFYTGMALLLKRGDEERFAVKEPFLSDSPNFVALTRNGKCAGKIEQVDAQLAMMKKNGVLEDLIRKSFQLWKARPQMVDR